MIQRVLRSVSDISYSVSFTTRQMRPSEENGKDYFFVSRQEFENLITEGEFLEYAEVHGYLYGTSRSQVRHETKAGKDVILEIDVQGAEIIRAKAPDAVGIFILPPSFEILRERLASRQTESEEDLALRLRNARDEVRTVAEFDYVIINNEVEQAVRDLERIILAERLKRERNIKGIEAILETFEEYKTNKIGD